MSASGRSDENRVKRRERQRESGGWRACESSGKRKEGDGESEGDVRREVVEVEGEVTGFLPKKVVDWQICMIPSL